MRLLRPRGHAIVRIIPLGVNLPVGFWVVAFGSYGCLRPLEWLLIGSICIDRKVMKTCPDYVVRGVYLIVLGLGFIGFVFPSAGIVAALPLIRLT